MNRKNSECALPSKAAEHRCTPGRWRVGHSRAHFRQVLECAAAAALWICQAGSWSQCMRKKRKEALHDPAANPPTSDSSQEGNQRADGGPDDQSLISLISLNALSLPRFNAVRARASFVVLRRACFLLLITLSWADLGATAPVNDRFSDRLILVGTNITVTGTNAGASKEPGEPEHAGNPGGKSVWWSWTAPTNGEVTITTDGSTNSDGSTLDTLLAVYTGSTVSSVSQVATNDDHGVQVTSRVKFEAVQTIQYQIAVDGYNNGTNVDSGSITLSLIFVSEPIHRPPNDDFTNRVFLGGAAVSTNASNVGATREPGEPFHAGKIGDTSVWWSWMAPTSASMRISTKGSSFDTLLAVYSGSSVSNLIEVASNDDADATAGILTSEITFNTRADEVFQIVVDGFDGASGQISLQIENVTTTLGAPFRSSDGIFQFTLDGLDAGTYEIDATTNFAEWLTLATLLNTNGTMIVTDLAATNFNRRFYRALLKP